MLAQLGAARRGVSGGFGAASGGTSGGSTGYSSATLSQIRQLQHQLGAGSATGGRSSGTGGAADSRQSSRRLGRPPLHPARSGTTTGAVPVPPPTATQLQTARIVAAPPADAYLIDLRSALNQFGGPGGQPATTQQQQPPLASRSSTTAAAPAPTRTSTGPGGRQQHDAMMQLWAELIGEPVPTSAGSTTTQSLEQTAAMQRLFGALGGGYRTGGTQPMSDDLPGFGAATRSSTARRVGNQANTAATNDRPPAEMKPISLVPLVPPGGVGAPTGDLADNYYWDDPRYLTPGVLREQRMSRAKSQQRKSESPTEEKEETGRLAGLRSDSYANSYWHWRWHPVNVRI